MSSEQPPQILYLYYDGECPLCSHAAKTVRIKKSLQLQLIDARSQHPQIEKIIELGYDLNEGIVVEYDNQIYYKEDALHLLAFLSTPFNLLNRISAFILRQKILTKILYPILKKIRLLLLWIRGKSLIHHEKQSSIFRPIFGKQWQNLPVVFHKQYANRAYSEDYVTAQGFMNIEFKQIFKPLLSVFSRIGIFIPSGDNLSVTVNFLSEKNSRYFIFQRRFYNEEKKTSHLFRTRLLQLNDNEVIDIMPFGFAWRLKYVVEENIIKFVHKGYALHFLGITLPLPLSFLIGSAYGEEVAISENEFSLFLELKHFLFGSIIKYSGNFKIIKNNVAEL